MCPRKGGAHNRSRLRTLAIGNHRVMASTLWARLGNAPGRWELYRHLQAHAGTVAVKKRSGKQHVVQSRFACDKSLLYVIDSVEECSPEITGSRHPPARAATARSSGRAPWRS